VPDVIEAARTGRAKCRRCGAPLPKGEPRFGEEVENTFGEGKALHWFHLMCAAEKRPDKFLVALEASDAAVADRDTLASIARAGVDNPNLTQVRRTERAKTGRSRCQVCREIIEKGALRVAIEREDELAMASVSFVHAWCAPGRLGLEGLLDKLRRTSPQLGIDDLDELARELEAGSG
jgi:hypothetical protein